jgi:hypothetical protein
MYKFVIIAIIAAIFLTVPASAQDPCGDLNCNGWCLEIADFVMALRIIGERCSFDSLQHCTLFEGDVDQDGYPITIADAMTMVYVIFGTTLPDFSRHPDSDTIKVESAIATPGETLELPIYINTIDTLTAFQLSIETDPAYVTVDTLIILDSMFSIFSYCSGRIYSCIFDEGILRGDSITLKPGEHHIADLKVTVNPEIEEPDTTYIEFCNDPENLYYSAFSNGPFFTPVTVDGEIQIITTGIENDYHDNIPGRLSINAYPNPFNASTTIEYGLPEAGHVRIQIYDLLGRQVETLIDEYRQAGVHAASFGASHLAGGVYFCRIRAGDIVETKRLVLLK